MSSGTTKTSHTFAAVVLAGGSGTRFWPRSRKARAKQVLQLDGERTMIQQTVARLDDVMENHSVWVITNDLLCSTIADQLPDIPRERLLCEPESRNTAPACALAAFLLEREDPETVIGIFPSDHTIGNVARFHMILRAGIKLAASGPKIVVLGVPPTRDETGYGYIELGAAVTPTTVGGEAIPVRRVRRFTEKPDRARARAFLRSGNYAWNSGMFLWSAKTLCDAIREHSPAMVQPLEKIAAAWKTPQFEQVYAAFYPQCESISIDYAILEPRSAKGETASELYCLPADFAWNDLGSWAALHEYQAETRDCKNQNVIESENTVQIESTGCYVFAPNKMVALVGVKDIVVVETEDALLVTTRQGSQDVGKVVKELKNLGRTDLI
jgi:mannose-1-phosphate guanylyltransferase